MSLLLSCTGISKTFSTEPLFSDLAFSIHEGDRIGIVGRNGAGKSTLLRILAGRMEADGGDIAKKKLLKLAYVEQESSFELQLTPRMAMEQEAAKWGIQAAEGAVEVDSILTKAGFTNPDVAISTLSGGWKKRLAIAMALFGNPDVIFFDEPTNHLDVDGVFWLETLLNQAMFTWVMISHDRYFLDRTIRKTVEVGPMYPGSLFVQEGNYSNFIEKRREFIAGLMKQEESLSNKVRREVEWLRRGPQARATKAKSRIDEAHKLMGELGELRQKLKKSDSAVDFSASGRKTQRLVALNDVSKSYDGKALFSGLNIVLKPKTILGILGPNGCGKSTLLRVLQKLEGADQGSVDHAPNLRMVYFDQNRDSIDPQLTLQDALNEQGGDSVIYRGSPVHIVTWARKFQFSNDQLSQPVARLSGGEKARVLIARLMLQDADVLILDEPTNDLDIETLEVLEESLLEFPGSVVLVTHDRYLMTRLADICVGFMPKGLTRLYADYQQWEKEYRQGGREKARQKKSSDGKVKPKKVRSGKLSYMEQREYDAMEEKILEAEMAVDEAQKTTENPEVMSNSQRLNEAYAELQKKQEDVEALYERWSILEEKIKNQ